jgi:hypothetical protein
LILAYPKVWADINEKVIQMNDSYIIDRLGGTCAVAEIFGISAPSVSGWRENGIPSARRQTLALMFPSKVPKSWLPKAPKKLTRKPSKRGK